MVTQQKKGKEYPKAEEIYKSLEEIHEMACQCFAGSHDIASKMIGSDLNPTPTSDQERPHSDVHFEEFINRIRDIRKVLNNTVRIQERLKSCI